MQQFTHLVLLNPRKEMPLLFRTIGILKKKQFHLFAFTEEIRSFTDVVLD